MHCDTPLKHFQCASTCQNYVGEFPCVWYSPKFTSPRDLSSDDGSDDALMCLHSASVSKYCLLPTKRSFLDHRLHFPIRLQPVLCDLCQPHSPNKVTCLAPTPCHMPRSFPLSFRATVDDEWHCPVRVLKIALAQFLHRPSFPEK